MDGTKIYCANCGASLTWRQNQSKGKLEVMPCTCILRQSTDPQNLKEAISSYAYEIECKLHAYHDTSCDSIIANMRGLAKADIRIEPTPCEYPACSARQNGVCTCLNICENHVPRAIGPRPHPRRKQGKKYNE